MLKPPRPTCKESEILADRNSGKNGEGHVRRANQRGHSDCQGVREALSFLFGGCMKKVLQMSFKLGEPNYNDRIYEPEMFKASMDRALAAEGGLKVCIGDSESEVQVGTVLGYNVTEGIVTATMDITDDRILGIINETPAPGVEFGPNGTGRIERTEKGWDVKDLEILRLRLLKPTSHDFVE